VLAARAVPFEFDARRAARIKRYGYLIETAPVAWPFLRGHAWHVGRPLDAEAMARALGHLRGKHDFAAFCAAPGRARDPACTVRGVRVVQQAGRIGILMSADAFLHHMVRNVVGTLVEVGRGRRPPDWVAAVLAGRDRRSAGPTAPAHGLHLLRVLYNWPLFPGGRHRRTG
jgi:tRNA pseudouridine38-40 synthase